MNFPIWFGRLLGVKPRELTELELKEYGEKMVKFLDNNPEDVFDNKDLKEVLEENKEEGEKMRKELIKFMKTPEFKKFQMEAEKRFAKHNEKWLKENHPELLK